MDIQAPWVGNPDYGRDFKAERLQDEERLSELREELEDKIMEIDEMIDKNADKNDISEVDYEIRMIKEEIEELEEDLV